MADVVDRPVADKGNPMLSPAQPASRRRVLLVEDSLMLRKLVRTMLLHEQVDVSVATNGQEAVESVAAAADGGRPFDLVLMDVVMPELNGVEATYQLRKRGFAGKVVILTAADAQFDMAASLCAGADDYLAKPFTPEQLNRVIHAHCPPITAAA
jgi:DNA-binding response OmpR family regulator